MSTKAAHEIRELLLLAGWFELKPQQNNPKPNPAPALDPNAPKPEVA